MFKPLAASIVFGLVVAGTSALTDANDRPIAPSSRPVVSRDVEGKKGAIFDDVNLGTRVSFVMDASGSMINKMATLKDQLKKTINGMSREQSFNVIFFQDNKCDMVSRNLLPTTAGNKIRADVFLDGVTTTGTTDPIPGIEAAFRQKPDTIYLLTDGDFPDNDAVLKKIRELNKDKKVRVYTIAFEGTADNDTAFKDLLKTIAKENGGEYKHVEEAKVK